MNDEILRPLKYNKSNTTIAHNCAHTIAHTDDLISILINYVTISNQVMPNYQVCTIVYK